MFTKVSTFSILAAAVSSVFGSPIDLVPRNSHHVEVPKFNDWHGIHSLHGFDDFYGYHNFPGISHRRVILKQKKELVCHRVQIEVIQQRLVVLQELAKKIITEQICEVETQTLVFQQFHSGLGYFRHDLSRKSGRHVGYDAHIAGQWQGLFNHDGSLSNHDLGFRGHDVGKHIIVASGHNWNPISSPPIIADIYEKSKKAIHSSSGCESDGSCDDGEPEVIADAAPDAEVTDAGDAPGPEETATATDSAADAEATDAGDDADVQAESASVTESATASASASAPAPTSSGNVDPATAP